MLKEFKQFLFRGNVIELAVAVMIGAAFGSVITALVSDMLTPLIATIVKTPDFNNLYFTINASKFAYGHFLNALISFTLLAVAIFFCIVKPLNMLMSRMNKQAAQHPTTKKCEECLSDMPLMAKRCSHCTQSVK